MPKTPPDNSEDAATRNRILTVTLRQLEDNGYASVTTESIAGEARISKATIYRLWPSKQRLVVDAARLRFGPVEVRDLGSFEKEIRWILEHRLADYREAGTLQLVASLVGAATTDATLKAVFEEWIDQLSDSIHRAIERGIARGDVHADVDTFALESLIAGVVARTVVTQTSFASATVDELAVLIACAAREPAGLAKRGREAS